MFVAVATLVGTPTGGALLKTVDQEHFNGLIIFSGVLTLAGTVVLAGAGVMGSERLRDFFTRRFKPSDAETSATEPSQVEKGR